MSDERDGFGLAAACRAAFVARRDARRAWRAGATCRGVHAMYARYNDAAR